MYQKMENNKLVKEVILADMYNIIGTSINRGLYAFKGGYVLGKKLKKGVRRTNDLDITVLNQDTFNLALSSLTGYLNSLKEQGIIWDYIVKMPEIIRGRNISGGVKLYVKTDANSRKRVLCGIDMSIHPLNEGVELSVEGYPQYSNELMLSDKVSALYKDDKSVIRRIRDVLDIYLILAISNNLNKGLILSKLKERGVDIQKRSTLEYMLAVDGDRVVSALNRLISEGDRVDKVSINGVDYNSIINKVCLFLMWLRRS